MTKEIGLPKSAPKAAKAADARMDKKKGLKEGSVADKKQDRAVMAKYGRGGKRGK